MVVGDCFVSKTTKRVWEVTFIFAEKCCMICYETKMESVFNKDLVLKTMDIVPSVDEVTQGRG